MTWFDVDGARGYLAHHGGTTPSRKMVYNLVAAGMKVARVGSTGRRLMFSAEWIDEYLESKAKPPAVESTRRLA